MIEIQLCFVLFCFFRVGDCAQLSSESRFFTLLENEVSKAEKFYRDRVTEMVENFYLLLQSAIEQGLIESFRCACFVCLCFCVCVLFFCFCFFSVRLCAFDAR